MGIYTERFISVRSGIAILAGIFAALYGIWLFAGPELVRSEVVYAAAAAEFSPRHPLLMTIHSWATPECFPLFPILARLLCDLTGMPMESALRGVSLLMLGAGAVLVYLAAGSRKSPQAGMVAAAMYSGCFLALGTAVEGTPATLNALLLAAAQLLFFQYGVRRSDWNRAWIYSAIAVTLGFLSGGFMVLIFFVFPMFFFRRPLSVSSKFRRSGFVAALILVALTALAWWGAFTSSGRQVSPYDMWWRMLSEVGLGWRILTFPVMVVFWMLPWSFIAWMPFCVALQNLDKTPIYSRYLRTLVFSTLALLWLLPEIGRYGLFYALAPLAVLTGRFYELGMWRYGAKLRRSFVVVELFMAAVMLVIVAGSFLPEALLGRFFSVGLSLDFRLQPWFRWTALLMLLAAALLAFYVHRRRSSDPVWMILLAASAAAALFCNGLLMPYKSQDRSKRDFGEWLRAQLPRSGEPTVYTRNIRNLNGGLFYAGVPVYRLDSGETFPIMEPEVYLLSGEIPQFDGYSGWERMGNYEYNNHPLALWRGRLVGAEAEKPPPGKNAPAGINQGEKRP